MRTRCVLDHDGHLVWRKQADRPAEEVRLAAEAAALAAIDHPNVVALVEFDGTRLSTALAGRSDLAAAPPADLTEVADVAEALVVILDELHAMGWTHGSLEPAHIVRGPGGRLVLCSWGRGRRSTDLGAPARRADRRALATSIRGWEEGAGPPRTRAERAATRRIRAAVARLHGRPSTAAPSPTPRRRGPRRARVMRRALARVATFAGLAALSWALHLPTGDPGPLGGLATAGWWAVRVGSLYGLVVSGVWLLATAARRAAPARWARRLAPGALRPVLLGVAAASSLTQVVASGPRQAPPILEAPADLGPAPRAPSTPPPSPQASPPVTRPAADPPDARPAETPTPPPTWLVRPGDHLWRIAEHTLAQRLGRAPSDGEVARYWTVLVSGNRDRLTDPANPDLVFPGQRFVLPP